MMSERLIKSKFNIDKVFFMKRIFICFMALIAFSGSAAVIKDKGQLLKKSDLMQVTSIRSVYDGDTFRAFLPHYEKDQRVRVRGVDTAEIKGQCPYEKKLAIRAREFTKNFLRKGTVYLRNISRDRYKRILADVYVDNKNLAEALIANELGRKWKGRRENWCE